jgi:hypothetical protein
MENVLGWLSVAISLLAFGVSIWALRQSSRFNAGARRVEAGKLAAEIDILLTSLKPRPDDLLAKWSAMHSALGQSESGRAAIYKKEFADFANTISARRARFDTVFAGGNAKGLANLEQQIVDLSALHYEMQLLRGQIDEYDRQHAVLAAERRAAFTAGRRANPGLATFRVDDGG